MLSFIAFATTTMAAGGPFFSSAKVAKVRVESRANKISCMGFINRIVYEELWIVQSSVKNI
jgi:hypothetical protein